MSEPAPFTGPNVQPGDFVDIVNEAGITVGRCQFWPMPKPADDPLPKLLEQMQVIDDGMRGYLSVIDRIMREDALAAETALRAELVDRIKAAWVADDEEAWDDDDLARVAVDTFAAFIREARQ